MASTKPLTRNAVKKTTPKTLTTRLTVLTHSAPSTPDYAIQQFTQSSPFGFVTSDEANTVLKVLVALEVRVYELEQKLQQYGLLG
jgi:hypothetical protein